MDDVVTCSEGTEVRGRRRDMRVWQRLISGRILSYLTALGLNEAERIR